MDASPQNDPELSDLLQTWQIEPDADSDLAAKVWRRIDSRSRRGGLLGWLDQCSRILTRPLVAATGLAACVALGFVVAEIRFEADRNDVLARVAAEYVRSIDPVVITGLHEANHRP